MATWGNAISLKGAKGEAGSKIYFVTGAPTDATASAVVGDCAFSADTFKFYQRTEAGWPTDGALLQGPMGINGVDGSFFTGADAPTADLGAGHSAIYFQATGEVWTRDVEGDWIDSGQNFKGAQGDVGPAGQDGARGTQTYTGQGAPSADLSTFVPPAVAGDLYYDLSEGGPTLYILGA